MKQNLILAGIVVVLGLAIVGGYFFPGSQLQQVAIGSPSGTTFNTAKVAEVNMVPTTTGTNATTSSILNSDASDRFITDAFVNCATSSGAVTSANGGVATWNWFAATTTSGTSLQLNAVPALSYALNVNVSTSTTDNEYIATSTYTFVATRRWLTGTYLTFGTNATSTNLTISCQVGVHYLQS